jgi:type 1 fimbriae regulatory protein FimB
MDTIKATDVAKLLDAMKQGRHGIRDHLLALMMFRHGLRVSEAIGIRRNEVDSWKRLVEIEPLAAV